MLALVAAMALDAAGAPPAPIAPAPAPAPVPTVPAPPPSYGVLLSLDAYGTLVSGHVVADAGKLGALGIELWLERSRVDAATVALAPGLRILGLPQGERIVEEAIDTLLYFDANGDTYLDAADPPFAALAVFQDRDGDQKIDAGEVRTLDAIGVASISRFGSVQMKPR